MDLEKLDLAELKILQKNVAIAIESYEDKRLDEARAMLEAQAKELGYNLSDLVGGKAKKAKAKSEPKYQHPENTEATWTGRGRKPNWIIEFVEAGGELESLLIAK